MSAKSKDVKLSRGLLDLKFMKRTREKVDQEKQAEVTQSMYGHLITEEMKQNDHIIFREVSVSFCKNLLDGRASFGGMNPKLEKVMEGEWNKRIGEAEKAREKDVSDELMAAKYSSLVDTVGSKFKSKKKGKGYAKPNTQEPLV